MGGTNWFMGTVKYKLSNNNNQYLVLYDDGEVHVETFNPNEWILVENDNITETFD